MADATLEKPGLRVHNSRSSPPQQSFGRYPKGRLEDHEYLGRGEIV